MSQKKLPGLNGLRAIAASVVLIGHVYQIAGVGYGVKEAEQTFNSFLSGQDMVNLFFVISGFIITYILLKEKNKFGDISLKHFYIKRLLRIWPLYFFLLAIVAVLSIYTSVYAPYGKIDSGTVLLASLFIVNFNPFLNVNMGVIPHFWSLSVEEQFYLYWPALLKKLNPLIVAVSILAFIVIFRNFTALMATRHHHEGFWQQIHMVSHTSRFGSMAIGAIGAIGLEQVKKYAAILFSRVVEVIFWGLFLWTLFSHVYIPYIHWEVMAVIYLYLILNVTTNPRPLISLENRFFDATGAISYGLYMYHYPLLPLVILLLKQLNLFEPFTAYHQVPLVILSFAATYLVSFISFKYLESPLLKLRQERKVKKEIITEPQSYAI